MGRLEFVLTLGLTDVGVRVGINRTSPRLFSTAFIRGNALSQFGDTGQRGQDLA
jgi:hypothetical protein